MAKVTLTKADMLALNEQDSSYLLDKGANLYDPATYDEAVEYYHIAAAMGNATAASNLGYCYLYGRSIEQNTSLAIAYFTIAAQNGNIEALYKLGNIYSNDKFLPADKELSVYYYFRALSALAECDREIKIRFPSLYLAGAKEMLPGGSMTSDIQTAHIFLLYAREGYEIQLKEGRDYYSGAYEETLRLLNSDIFKDITVFGGDYLESDNDPSDETFLN